MGTGRKIAIHTNFGYKHQRDWAHSLAEGCKLHGDVPDITPNPSAAGDVHIVLGPHYAMREHIGKTNVILLDRCYYGDTDNVASLGWLKPDGSRTFAIGVKRKRPAVKQWKSGGKNRVLILADFGQDVSQLVEEAKQHFDEVLVRLHPANAQKSEESLVQAISKADVVVGTAGTALVQALLDGVPTTCLDPRHIARPVTSHVIGDIIMPDRSTWLDTLAYAVWSHAEMRSGLLWEHLNDNEVINRHAADCRTCNTG